MTSITQTTNAITVAILPIYELTWSDIKPIGIRTINTVKYNAQIGFLSQVISAITAAMPASTYRGAYGEEIRKKEAPVMRANRMDRTIKIICHALTGFRFGFLISII
jgi:hypothetical protein